MERSPCPSLHAIRRRLLPQGPSSKPVFGLSPIGTYLRTTGTPDRWAGTTKGARMDAVAMLKEEHDKVKKLLTELDSTTERGVKTRTELFGKVKQELTVHETIEEEIFYPAL